MQNYMYIYIYVQIHICLHKYKKIYTCIYGPYIYICKYIHTYFYIQCPYSVNDMRLLSPPLIFKKLREQYVANFQAKIHNSNGIPTDDAELDISNHINTGKPTDTDEYNNDDVVDNDGDHEDVGNDDEDDDEDE